MKSIADSLPPGTSALVIIIKDAWVDKLFTTCSEYECKIMEQELSEEVIAELTDESN